MSDDMITVSEGAYVRAATLPAHLASHLKISVKRATSLLEKYGSPVTYQIGGAVLCKRDEVAEWIEEAAQRESIGKRAACSKCGETRNLPGGILCPQCRAEIEATPLHPEGSQS
jgi:hypothetical protein